MRGERLLERLRVLDPPDTASCFVLVWTYFQDHGLVQVENALVSRRIHPTSLERHPMSVDAEPIAATLPDIVAELGRIASTDEFEILALRWLKALDFALSKLRRSTYAEAELPGLDDRPYRLCPRNHFLATREGARVTWAADQSTSLATYTPNACAIPREPIDGRQIEPLGVLEWGDESLHDRLKAARADFRVVLWPFTMDIDFPERRTFYDSPRPPFVRLADAQNDSDVAREALRALDCAAEKRATLLLMPELAISERTESAIRETLRSHGRDGFPILTLFGRTHRKAEGGDADLNEAVLLGPDGTPLHIHRKLTSFTDVDDAKGPWGERNLKGETLSVLESALGNLIPLICLDVFQAQTKRLVALSHGNVLLVPSLSPKTGPHMGAATDLQATLLASTFVCNRPLFGEPSTCPAGSSFYRVPSRKRAERRHEPGSEGEYLLFDIRLS